MSAFRLTLALVAGGFTIAPAGHAQEVRPDEVIAVERAALDRWGRGDRTIHSHWSFTKPELNQAPIQ